MVSRFPSFSYILVLLPSSIHVVFSETSPHPIPTLSPPSYTSWPTLPSRPALVWFSHKVPSTLTCIWIPSPFRTSFWMVFGLSFSISVASTSMINRSYLRCSINPVHLFKGSAPWLHHALNLCVCESGMIPLTSETSLLSLRALTPPPHPPPGRLH